MDAQLAVGLLMPAITSSQHIIIIIITRVSGQVHCAYSRNSTLVQDTIRRPAT
jgi:hypothetical protein